MASRRNEAAASAIRTDDLAKVSRTRALSGHLNGAGTGDAATARLETIAQVSLEGHP